MIRYVPNTLNTVEIKILSTFSLIAVKPATPTTVGNT